MDFGKIALSIRANAFSLFFDRNVHGRSTDFEAGKHAGCGTAQKLPSNPSRTGKRLLATRLQGTT